MSSFLTNLSNTISYKLNQATTNPDAQRYSDEQERLQKQKEEEEKKSELKIVEKENAKSKQEAALKKANSSNPTNIIKEVVYYISISFVIFLFILFAIYAGHLAANDAIGREISYRVLYFIYGIIFSPFVVLYYIIQYMRGHSIRSYALLPIREGEVPRGLEGFFLSLISYIPDEESINAKKIFDGLVFTAGRV